jgi:uncharacterized protein YdhG (YjbR/CyaY superfamily)
MATKKADDASKVLATIAEMPPADREIAERLHEIITTAAPELTPRLWYTQPAYAKDGKVVCFFRGAAKDDERYLSFGFSSNASLDDGSFWPTSYAVTKVSDADAKKITALVKKAVS